MTLILMIIIIKIFSGIFLCTLLGTILYLFWKAVGRLIEHKGYVQLSDMEDGIIDVCHTNHVDLCKWI